MNFISEIGFIFVPMVPSTITLSLILFLCFLCDGLVIKSFKSASTGSSNLRLLSSKSFDNQNKDSEFDEELGVQPGDYKSGFVSILGISF